MSHDYRAATSAGACRSSELRSGQFGTSLDSVISISVHCQTSFRRTTGKDLPLDQIVGALRLKTLKARVTPCCDHVMSCEGEAASAKRQIARKEHQGPKGILGLPEDVQARVLRPLGTLHLKTARITCKDFHKASIPCITKLHANCIATEENSLKRCLDSCTSITELSLDICTPTSVLGLTSVQPILCELNLRYEPDPDNDDDEGLKGIIKGLGAASKVTALQIDGELADGFSSIEAAALQDCKALKKLSFMNMTIVDPKEVVEALGAVTSLCEFQFCSDDATDLRTLPILTMFRQIVRASYSSRLRSLEGMPLKIDSDVES
eukprot:jgi/Botrbrau1/4500/Bobra.0220s0033.1